MGEKNSMRDEIIMLKLIIKDRKKNSMRDEIILNQPECL